MKKLLIYIILACTVTYPTFAATVFDLQSSNDSYLSVSKELPQLYKPTRLIIGQVNKIKLKAEPNSFATLITSFENTGTLKFQDHELQLGEKYKVVQSRVNENGIAEFDFELDDDEELIGKSIYLAVAVWKKQDYSDLLMAELIAPNGQESKSNKIVIHDKPSKPGFAGLIPGPASGQQVLDSVKYMTKEDDEEQGLIDIYDVQYNTNTPAMIRNMDVIESE